jgi:protein gp37
MATSIEWTDVTWNPTRGCSVVSPGCKHCYAMAFAARFTGPGMAYEGLAVMHQRPPRVLRRDMKDGSVRLTQVAGRKEGRWTGVLRLVHEHLPDPFRWAKPRRVFVNSMSDLFHEGLTNEEIAAVFGVMAACPDHTFQILTKRAERMREWFRWVATFPSWRHLLHEVTPPALKKGGWNVFGIVGRQTWPLPNVWLGVSVEDQHYANERIPLLLDTPAAVRFISAEPLLGPVDLTGIALDPAVYGRPGLAEPHIDALRRDDDEHFYNDHQRLDWVIVGGESGNRARPFEMRWARQLVRQCRDAGVRVFVKQMGAKAIGATGGLVKLRSRKGGDPAEWPEDLRVREFPAVGGAA